ncbi:hypothetical protein PSU4_38890 [Pseudonocardia sulfidoxydans NBRC 16205]|uniref:Uncharacterized protein n=1 Tax=Pseudonocardia sulfidoxydans NBRC 16205 TaxID=1223511 RepID=A0A511DJF1_9PSEU|nr:hypothetical protein PSU4_38890 [Pseudonocardia sulfidoxydans NBRC 16205]
MPRRRPGPPVDSAHTRQEVGMVGDTVTWFDPSRGIGATAPVAAPEAPHAVDVSAP